MLEFILLMGLPGSGKTTYAKQLAETKNAIVLSSDELRLEMFGYLAQDRNDELFRELNARLLENLNNGVSVIYDATNVNSKRRYNLLKMLPDNVWKECHFINRSVDTCISNDLNREYKVEEHVIKRIRTGLQIPMKYEGWDYINVIVDDENLNVLDFKESLSKLSDVKMTIEEFDKLLNVMGIKGLLNVPQDNLHHTLSIGRHSYEVYKYVFDNYFEQDREIMLLTAILHDIGKVYCKTFTEDSKYAVYKGHDNVSAQLTLSLLKQLRYPKALQVAELIQLHMRLSWRDTPEANVSNEVLLKLVGQTIYDKLVFFRKADMSGK